MTDSDRSMNEVPGLIAERRRYEGWLTALDARRESTPAHVFERVERDYRERLQRVGEQLGAHRQSIEEARASVQSRFSLLEAEERLRRDERAELDLRAHVGELVDQEAETAFRAVDDAIAQLVSEKEGLESRIVELQALLDDGAPTPVAARAPVKSATPQPVVVQKGTEPELVAPAGQSPGAPVVSPELDPARAPTGAFDELAFLSSVVGPEDDEPMIQRRDSAPSVSLPDGIVRDREQGESLLAGVEKAKHPLATNVPGHTPIAIRPTAGTLEQSKTLKCGECGALNYPTEWYCERCGAELTTL
jgi:hypothetical protein